MGQVDLGLPLMGLQASPVRLFAQSGLLKPPQVLVRHLLDII